MTTQPQAAWSCTLGGSAAYSTTTIVTPLESDPQLAHHAVTLSVCVPSGRRQTEHAHTTGSALGTALDQRSATGSPYTYLTVHARMSICRRRIRTRWRLANWGAKGGAARAKALSARRRKAIAVSAAQARSKGLTRTRRIAIARHAVQVRWARARAAARLVTAKDAPEAVQRLLKTYDPAQLRWAVPDDRYAIVKEVLTRGDENAKAWLSTVASRSAVRELVREYAGTGCSESERERLRQELRLTVEDIPRRPHRPELWRGA